MHVGSPGLVWDMCGTGGGRKTDLQAVSRIDHHDAVANDGQHSFDVGADGRVHADGWHACT
jgi:hypothetical protein